jgi:hypothetical protein
LPGYITSNEVYIYGGEESHTLSIYEVGEVKTLDEKFIPTATDDEIISMLLELDMLPAITDSDGAILTDGNNNILLW